MPSKLHAIPGLLEKYAADPGEIVGKVEEKYLTPPSSAGALMKQVSQATVCSHLFTRPSDAERCCQQNKRMKAARALVQQKAVIAKSWPLWYDDMRASVPCKLWPLPGEALPPPAEELPTNCNLRCEAGGAAEWLASSWDTWRAERPAFFTPKFQHSIAAHFLPAGAELDPEGAEEEEAPVEAHVFGGPAPPIVAGASEDAEAVWVAPVNAWLKNQKWRSFSSNGGGAGTTIEVDIRDYRIMPSAVQSCAAGLLALDVDCVADWDAAPSDCTPLADPAAERLRLSRVVEVNAQTGEVATVLAARGGGHREQLGKANEPQPA